MSAILHYLYDPLCGWCYGAEPLLEAARKVDGLELSLHGGGLWPQPTRLPDETRRYIKQADARVAAMSGQPYGDAYLDGLLFDAHLVLDSKPTTAAVLAAESLDPTQAIAMLKGIQHAHYEHGRHVVEHDVLVDIAVAIGLDRSAFERALGTVDADAHIATTRRLMAQTGARGFPTFLLQLGEQWYGVPHQQFASDPTGLAAWLADRIESSTATPSA